MTKNKESNKQMSVFSLTWPIFIEILLFMLLGSVDTFMLSHYSDNAVAAVGVSNQFMYMMNIMFGIISGGTAILVAQYLGAKNKKMASKVTMVSLTVNLIFGLIISGFMFFGGKLLLHGMNIRPDLMKYAEEYLKIVGGFLFIQSVLMTMTSVIRTHGFTKVTMYITLGMNLINAIGDYAFIYGPFGIPKLGVKGVAMATTFSKLIGLIIVAILLVKKVEKNLSLKYLNPFPKKILKDLLKIGMPTAGEQLMYNTSQLVITYFINFLGNEALTTKSYVQSIVMFSFLFSSAIGQGTQIIIGHLVGQDNKEKAYKLCIRSLKIGATVSFVIAVIFAIGRYPIIKIFTNNDYIITVGATVLIIDAILEPGRAFNLVVINSLRAAGDVTFPVIMGVISMWGISVTLAYFLGIYLGLGLPGMWIAFACDEWARGIFMLGRWKSRKWESMSFVK